MTAHRVELVGAALTIALAVVAVLRWRHALDGIDSVTGIPEVIVRAPSLVPVDEDSIIDAATAVAANDPFRLSNAPAAIAFSPSLEGGGLGGGAAPVVVRVRPTLALRGIIGGPPWQAIVDGLPGQPPGSIVRPGMTFDKLVIRSISRDTVLVQSPDTSWKLTLGRGAP